MEESVRHRGKAWQELAQQAGHRVPGHRDCAVGGVQAAGFGTGRQGPGRVRDEPGHAGRGSVFRTQRPLSHSRAHGHWRRLGAAVLCHLRDAPRGRRASHRNTVDRPGTAVPGGRGNGRAHAALRFAGGHWPRLPARIHNGHDQLPVREAGHGLQPHGRRHSCARARRRRSAQTLVRAGNLWSVGLLLEPLSVAAHHHRTRGRAQADVPRVSAERAAPGDVLGDLPLVIHRAPRRERE